jgi:ABC-type polysaccharide/polyol phosphate export permease
MGHYEGYGFANKVLLTIGTITSSIGINIHEIHEILSVVLQITGLISFIIYVIINWDGVLKQIRKWSLKEAKENESKK